MKKRTMCKLLMALAVIFMFGCSGVDSGQNQDDPSLLTVDRIFLGREFSGERFGRIRWLEDRSGYVALEPSQKIKRGRDIVKYDPATGQGEVLIPADQFIPEGETEALAIQDYAWTKDGKKLLIFTNTRRVWRRNTRGDYWVLDLASGKLHRLGGDAEPSTLMFAKFSPSGDRVAYVVKNNIYVENLTNFKFIRAGYSHNLILKNDGSVWTWGYNNDGQLGLGHNGVVLVPTLVYKIED